MYVPTMRRGDEEKGAYRPLVLLKTTFYQNNYSLMLEEHNV